MTDFDLYAILPDGVAMEVTINKDHSVHMRKSKKKNIKIDRADPKPDIKTRRIR